jgi:hypothetical protein
MFVFPLFSGRPVQARQAENTGNVALNCRGRFLASSAVKVAPSPLSKPVPVAESTIGLTQPESRFILQRQPVGNRKKTVFEHNFLPLLGHYEFDEFSTNRFQRLVGVFVHVDV